MKHIKILLLTAALSLALLSTGCIEISTLVTVNKDGSGTLEETVMLSSEIIEMITELQKSFAEDTAETEPFQFYNEEDLKTQTANFGEEVRYISSQKINRDEKEGYVVMYEFRDLNKLKINQNPNSRVKLESFEDEPEVEEEFLTFGFMQGDPAEVRVQMPVENNIKADTGSAVVEDTTISDTTALNEQLAKIFKDLKISMAIKVDGKITDTNADYVDGSEITLLQIDFNELLSNAEKFRKFRTTNPQTFEEVKEILKGIPGIKIDTKESVFVRFE
jgi:hypothetical protein